MKKTLQEIGFEYGTDKATFHKFCDFYAKFFDSFRNESFNLLEIGVLEGKSIAMWNDYFPNAIIEGADIINIKLPNNCKLHYLDCENNSLLEKFRNENKEKYRIVIDDAGHTQLQQQLTISNLFDCVKPGGYYILEDLHTSFMPYLARCNKENLPVTMELINALKWGNEFSSFAISSERVQEIISQIENIEVFSRIPNDYSNSVTCIIKKFDW